MHCCAVLRLQARNVLVNVQDTLSGQQPVAKVGSFNAA
jgi:hypothetical protein